MGINNKGQVVSGYIPSANADVQAWVWLPSTDYGLSAGFYNLTTLSSSPTPSLAADINESGVIVGRAGEIIGISGSRGSVWTLASGSATHVQLGTLDSSSTWSAAFALNDDSPPVIVGESGADRTCSCQEDPPPAEVVRGIQLSFTSPYTLTELSPSPDAYGSATDLNTPSSGSPLVSGWADCADGEENDLCRSLSQCPTFLDAVTWSSGTRHTLTDLGTRGSQTRSVNDAGNLAGWGFTDQTQCQRRALYWDNNTATPVNLGALLTSGDPTRAESLNHSSPPQVVGWNTGNVGALLWEKVGTNWTVVDLNDSAVIGGCESYWTLVEAHDINDHGWIITHGTSNNTYPGGNYAILLTPFPDCPTDINRDGCIDVNDLLAVLNTWGNCPIGSICHADVNGTCAVDVDDMLAVNNTWCPEDCPDPVPTCCESCAQCQESLMGGGDGVNGPLSISELIALIGTSNLTAEQQAEAIEQLLENQE